MKLRKLFESDEALSLTHEALGAHGFARTEGRTIAGSEYHAPPNHESAPGVHDTLKSIGWKQSNHSHDADHRDDDEEGESGIESHRYEHPDIHGHSLVVHRSYSTHDTDGEPAPVDSHAAEFIPKSSKMYFG